MYNNGIVKHMLVKIMVFVVCSLVRSNSWSNTFLKGDTNACLNLKFHLFKFKLKISNFNP